MWLRGYADRSAPMLFAYNKQKATADFLWNDSPKYVGDYMHVSLAFAFSLLPFANIQMYHQGVKLTGPRSGTT